MLAVRDSAEKAWNAVVQAVNALVLKYMERIPLSRFERRKMLREIEGKDRRVEELGTLDAWPGIRSSRGKRFMKGS